MVCIQHTDHIQYTKLSKSNWKLCLLILVLSGSAKFVIFPPAEISYYILEGVFKIVYRAAQ